MLVDCWFGSGLLLVLGRCFGLVFFFFFLFFWLGLGQGGEGFFHRGGVVYVEGVEGGVVVEDLGVEAGEDFAGAYFDEEGGGLGEEELDALDPADRGGDLADEGVAGV